MINYDEIDWARVAKPQPDGYDSTVMAMFLHDRWRWEKRVPLPGEKTIIRGAVAVLPDPYNYRAPFMQEGFSGLTDEELAAVDKHLAAWPDGYTALSRFLDEYWPKRWEGMGMGSSSSHQPMNDNQRTVNVSVTINDPEGCAEGIYHETGHFRLETVGMNINDHDGLLISNPITDGFQSPVRKSDPVRDEHGNIKKDGDGKEIRVPVLRPMCAVIHGEYAWIMLSELDLWCAENLSLQDASQYLTWNIPKVKEGLEEIERFAAPTKYGEAFLKGMLEWGHDVVVRGEAVLAQSLTKRNA